MHSHIYLFYAHRTANASSDSNAMYYAKRMNTYSAIIL